jgi:hypothetical protein
MRPDGFTVIAIPLSSSAPLGTIEVSLGRREYFSTGLLPFDWRFDSQKQRSRFFMFLSQSEKHRSLEAQVQPVDDDGEFLIDCNERDGKLVDQVDQAFAAFMISDRGLKASGWRGVLQREAPRLSAGQKLVVKTSLGQYEAEALRLLRQMAGEDKTILVERKPGDQPRPLKLIQAKAGAPVILEMQPLPWRFTSPSQREKFLEFLRRRCSPSVNRVVRSCDNDGECRIESDGQMTAAIDEAYRSFIGQQARLELGFARIG